MKKSVLIFCFYWKSFVLFFQKRSFAGVAGRPYCSTKYALCYYSSSKRRAGTEGHFCSHYLCLVKWDYLQSEYKRFAIFLCQLGEKRSLFLTCIGLGLFGRGMSGKEFLFHFFRLLFWLLLLHRCPWAQAQGPWHECAVSLDPTVLRTGWFWLDAFPLPRSSREKDKR